MTHTRHTLVALGLFAVACGGTVNTVSDGIGGGAQAGNGGVTAGAGGNSPSGGAAGASGVVVAGAGGAGIAGAGGAGIAGAGGVVAGAGGIAGASGGGGVAGDAGLDGRDGDVCPTGTVTFRMKPAPGKQWCTNSSAWDWFSIRPLGGQNLQWMPPCIGCNDGGPGWGPMGTDWLQVSWDGAYYGMVQCDASAHYCADKHCAPPGKYVATWRAGPAEADGTCRYGSTPVIHEETFDWPATTTLSWVTGESDGGSPTTCGGEPVWLPTSTGFSFNVSGGMPLPTVTDAGCRAANVTYDVSTSAGTLSRRGCDPAGPLDQSFALTALEVDQIKRTMGALWTTCASSRCGADAPSQVLAVWEGTDAKPPRTFTGDFYAGCPYNTPTPPYVDNGALFALEADLKAIIAARWDGADPPWESGVDAPGD